VAQAATGSGCALRVRPLSHVRGHPLGAKRRFEPVIEALLPVIDCGGALLQTPGFDFTIKRTDGGAVFTIWPIVDLLGRRRRSASSGPGRRDTARSGMVDTGHQDRKTSKLNSVKHKSKKKQKHESKRHI